MEDFSNDSIELNPVLFENEPLDEPIVPANATPELEETWLDNWHYIRNWSNMKSKYAKTLNIRLSEDRTFRDGVAEMFKAMDGVPFKIRAENGFLLRKQEQRDGDVYM